MSIFPFLDRPFSLAGLLAYLLCIFVGLSLANGIAYRVSEDNQRLGFVLFGTGTVLVIGWVFSMLGYGFYA